MGRLTELGIGAAIGAAGALLLKKAAGKKAFFHDHDEPEPIIVIGDGSLYICPPVPIGVEFGAARGWIQTGKNGLRYVDTTRVMEIIRAKVNGVPVLGLEQPDRHRDVVTCRFHRSTGLIGSITVRSEADGKNISLRSDIPFTDSRWHKTRYAWWVDEEVEGTVATLQRGGDPTEIPLVSDRRVEVDLR